MHEICLKVNHHIINYIVIVEQSKNNELEKTNTQITPNNDDMEEHDKQDEKTLLLPLYRCIYLDPNSFSKNDKGEKEEPQESGFELLTEEEIEKDLRNTEGEGKDEQNQE